MATRSSGNNPQAEALTPELTSLLAAWSAGDATALEELFPIVVNELRRQARLLLSQEPKGHTLQPTALVHELYMRVAGRRTVSFHSRGHFFGFAAQAMRRILVDYARTKKRKKRNSGRAPLPLDAADGVALPPPEELLALDLALQKLEKLDPRQARILELRFFVGLTLEQIAESLGISRTVVCRELSLAKAWLRRELGDG